jgi:hypothetical protein
MYRLNRINTDQIPSAFSLAGCVRDPLLLLNLRVCLDVDASDFSLKLPSLLWAAPQSLSAPSPHPVVYIAHAIGPI